MDNQLAVKQETSLRSVMRSDEIVTRFADVVGDQNARGYISSVLIAVAQNDQLKACDQNSVIGSALRAATMRLSVDPSTGQAHLVPFKGKCTLIVGWRGIYHMALRTNKYKYINLVDIYESDELVQDRMTGDILLKVGEFKFIPGQRSHPTGKIVGHLLAFEMVSGFKKSIYMTCQECEEHGAKYSKTYNYESSTWKTDPEAMHRKTVVRMGLTKWGYLDPYDMLAMNESEEAETENYVDGVTVPDEPEKTVEQSISDLGFEPEFEEAEPSQPELEPADITSTVYWNYVLQENKKDRSYGSKLLEKNGGDFAAAYYEAKKG